MPIANAGVLGTPTFAVSIRDADDQEVGRVDVEGLDGGGSTVARVLVPVADAKGELIAVLDADGVADECDETNNETALGVLVSDDCAGTDDTDTDTDDGNVDDDDGKKGSCGCNCDSSGDLGVSAAWPLALLAFAWRRRGSVQLRHP